MTTPTTHDLRTGDYAEIVEGRGIGYAGRVVRVTDNGVTLSLRTPQKNTGNLFVDRTFDSNQSRFVKVDLYSEKLNAGLIASTANAWESVGTDLPDDDPSKSAWEHGYDCALRTCAADLFKMIDRVVGS